MSVWLAIPSKRPVEQVAPVLQLWRDRGYKIALFRDWADDPIGVQAGYGEKRVDAPIVELVDRKYPGYAVAVNLLIGHVLEVDPEAEWIVTGGDDIEPEPNKTAKEIEWECKGHFFKENVLSEYRLGKWHGRDHGPVMETFGVMQPTGDRWGEHRGTHKWEPWPDHPERCIRCGQGEDSPPHAHGAYADRVCGSPWLGREFCARMYGGKGPYWPEYTHMGVDEELQAVALKLGVLWQRPDLTHYHRHWGRAQEGHQYAEAGSMPEFLKAANSVAEWDRYKRIFNARRAAGFPGSEPK